MLLLLLLHICETLAVLEQDLSIRVCLSVCYLVHSASCSLCSYLLFHTREFHLFMSLNKILLLDLSHSPYILLCCLDTFYTVATENDFVLKWDTGTSLRCWLHFLLDYTQRCNWGITWYFHHKLGNLVFTACYIVHVNWFSHRVYRGLFFISSSTKHKTTCCFYISDYKRCKAMFY